MIVTRVMRDITRGRTERGLLKLLSVGDPPGEEEGGGGAIPVVTGESAIVVVELVSSMVDSCLWS